MATTNVMEGLASLCGVRLDDATRKRLNDGIEQTAAGVKAMAEGATGFATRLTETAKKLEPLYFQSQRTGASVQNLKALDFAAQNTGVPAEAASASVDNLDKYLKSAPAAEKAIGKLGVNARTANGDLRDTVAILTDVGTRLAQLPQAEGDQQASAFGIDGKLLDAMRNGDFAAFVQQYRDLSQHASLDQAASHAHAFMEQIRGLSATFDVFSMQAGAALFAAIEPQLASLREYLTAHGDEIAVRVGDVARTIGSALQTVLPFAGRVLDQFLQLDQATNGLSTQIALAAVAFKALGGPGIVGGIWNTVNALRQLATAGRGAATIAGTVGAGTGSAGTGAGGVLGRAAGALGRVGGRIAGRIAAPLARAAGPAAAVAEAGMLGWQAGALINDHVVSKLPTVANGIGEGVTRVAALFGSSEAQQALDFNRKQAAAAARAADNQAALTAQALHNSDRLASDALSPRAYGIPAASDGGTPANAPASFSTNAQIHIHGVSDPAAAGREVATELRRVAGEMVRNMQGGYR